MLLFLFVTLQIAKFVTEIYLGSINRSYYENKENQIKYSKTLGLESESFSKTLQYTRDKETFRRLTSTFDLVVFLSFLTLGGAGMLEKFANKAAYSLQLGSVATGIIFFGALGILSSLWSMPFDYFATFYIEGKYGFNRQSPKVFFIDRLKGLAIAAILGSVCLGAVLWVMEVAQWWWIYAWLFISGFQLLTLWLYPSLLAPLFNKFTPISEGSLKDKIYALASKVGFNATGLFSMDASIRSTHGNAYFTGIFGGKRIVLFDTLLSALSENEIVAVLAHELGHFKLKHVRWMLIRGLAATAAIFYGMGLLYPYDDFYSAFYLDGVSNYGALFVFSQWFGIVGFVLSPMGSWLSRKNEFAADEFAARHIENPIELSNALLKLSKSNHSMPIVHPLYSRMYHSHPPLLERLTALKYS